MIHDWLLITKCFDWKVFLRLCRPESTEVKLIVGVEEDAHHLLLQSVMISADFGNDV